MLAAEQQHQQTTENDQERQKYKFCRREMKNSFSFQNSREID